MLFLELNNYSQRLCLDLFRISAASIVQTKKTHYLLQNDNEKNSRLEVTQVGEYYIREYASTPYKGMTQSSHWLNSRIKPALFFLSSAHRVKNFSSSRYYFSHFFPKISSLYLAKPWKYDLLQFWRFHLGCSFIIFLFFFFFFIIRLNVYEAYL